MKKKRWGAVKAFAFELVKKKTKAQQERSEPSAKEFAMELAIFAALVTCYFFLVLSLLSHWLKNLFDQNKLIYAFVAWGVMAAQGVILEVVAAALLKFIESKRR
jgi:hypothetical protein